MLDIKFIRENVELVKEAARKKRVDFAADPLVETDRTRVRLVGEIDDLRKFQCQGLTLTFGITTRRVTLDGRPGGVS